MANNPYKEYQFPVAALNQRVNDKRLAPGQLGEATGIDGRYTGGLKNFFGMSRTRNMRADDSITEVAGAWPLTLQKGTTNFLFRGWLVLHNSSGWKLTYVHYDESGSAWGTAHTMTLSGITLTATSVIDVSGPVRFAYIAIEGETPMVLYHTGSAFTEAQMGPGDDFDSLGDTGLAAPVDADEVGADTGFLIATGIYSYAYRYRNSTRGIYSDLSTIYVDTITASLTKVLLTNPDGDPDRAFDAGYTHLQIMRSISSTVAGSAYDGGILYLETEYALDSGADCWPDTVEVGILQDQALVQKDVYDPGRDTAGSPPNGGAIYYLEGVNFLAGDTSAGSVVSQFHFSHLHRDNPEVFPTNGNAHRWAAEDGTVLSFQRAGDLLYAFTRNAAFRIAKVGAQLSVDRVANRGITGKFAAHSLGRDILAMTDLGVVMFDGLNGTTQTVGAFDRIIQDTWQATLGNVFTVNDEALGASYFINTSTKTGLALWHKTGAVTQLDDCNFVAGLSSPDPSTGGGKRAFFFTPGGLVVTADLLKAGTGTMLGLDSGTPINGTCAANGTSNTAELLSVADDEFVTNNLVGATIYVWADAITPPESQTISTVNVDKKTVDISGTFSRIPQLGDRWAISPVPFRVRCWPAGAGVANYDNDRKVIKDLRVYTTTPTGISSNENAFFQVGTCVDLTTTPSEVKSIAMGLDPDAGREHVSSHGFALQPWAQVIAGGVDFELISIGCQFVENVGRSDGP